LEYSCRMEREREKKKRVGKKEKKRGGEHQHSGRTVSSVCERRGNYPRLKREKKKGEGKRKGKARHS